MQKVGESGMKKPVFCLVEVSYERNCGTFYLIQKWDCAIFMDSSMFVCIYIIYIYTHISIYLVRFYKQSPTTVKSPLRLNYAGCK